MLLGISLPVILILAIAGFTIMSSVNNSVSGIVKNNLTSDSMYLSKQVSSFLPDYISTSQTGAGTSEIINYIIDTKPGEKFADKPQWAQIRTSLINYTVVDPENILRVWIADFDSSQIIASDDIVTDESFDVTTRPWYVVNEVRQPVGVPPYKDTAVDSLVITVASPVIDPKTDKVVGAFAYDIQIGQLSVVRLKSYIGYIQEITEVLNQIAVGRLQFDLRQEYAGEFSTIKEALFDIRDTLSQTIYEIKEVATQVNSNSMQLSTGSQILVQGTTEQASSIEELSSTITDIANASQEQAFAVSQINQGLEQIASVVHTNAATAEESAASSKELSNQAELLQDLVDKFEI